MSLNISPCCLDVRGHYMPTPIVADGSFLKWRFRHNRKSTFAAPIERVKSICECGMSKSRTAERCADCSRTHSNRKRKPGGICCRCKKARRVYASYCKECNREYHRERALRRRSD